MSGHRGFDIYDNRVVCDDRVVPRSTAGLDDTELGMLADVGIRAAECPTCRRAGMFVESHGDRFGPPEFGECKDHDKEGRS
ncbi:MAG: hypothetical protein ABIJ75_10610 [Actinomycetota bacterium]